MTCLNRLKSAKSIIYNIYLKSISLKRYAVPVERCKVELQLGGQHQLYIDWYNDISRDHEDSIQDRRPYRGTPLWQIRTNQVCASGRRPNNWSAAASVSSPMEKSPVRISIAPILLAFSGSIWARRRSYQSVPWRVNSALRNAGCLTDMIYHLYVRIRRLRHRIIWNPIKSTKYYIINNCKLFSFHIW